MVAEALLAHLHLTGDQISALVDVPPTNFRPHLAKREVCTPVESPKPNQQQLPHQARDEFAGRRSEQQTRLGELWLEPPKLLGPLSQSEEPSAELLAAFKAVAEDPARFEAGRARFEQLGKDARARMKQFDDASASQPAPTPKTTQHSCEQQQASAQQHPGPGLQR